MRTYDISRKVKYLIIGFGTILLVPVVPSAFALVNAAGRQAPLHVDQSTARFADRQYADDDDAPRPFVNRGEDEDESAEHARHEEQEERLRERAHEFGERQEERAEHLENRLNQERAEPERHEMNERHH